MQIAEEKENPGAILFCQEINCRGRKTEKKQKEFNWKKVSYTKIRVLKKKQKTEKLI